MSLDLILYIALAVFILIAVAYILHNQSHEGFSRDRIVRFIEGNYFTLEGDDIFINRQDKVALAPIKPGKVAIVKAVGDKISYRPIECNKQYFKMNDDQKSVDIKLADFTFPVRSFRFNNQDDYNKFSALLDQ